MKFQSVICFACIWVLNNGCNSSNGPSPDTEDNRFYSNYRDIYNSYTKIPLDSTRLKLDSYLKEFPENANAWAFYGNVCFRMGNDKQAIISYRKALEIDDEKANYYSGLGTVFSANNQLDSAEKFLLKALELKDSSANTLLNLSMLYIHKNEREKSIAFTDATRQMKDASALTDAGLSFVYSTFGEQQKSIEMFESAKAKGLKDTAGFTHVLQGKMKIEEYYRNNSY